MSLHPSLKGLDALLAKKSVLKRGERIKWLMDHKKWNENSSILGLPKIKIVRIKLVKKEKKEEKPAEGAVVPEPGKEEALTQKPQPSQKPQA